MRIQHETADITDEAEKAARMRVKADVDTLPRLVLKRKISSRRAPLGRKPPGQ